MAVSEVLTATSMKATSVTMKAVSISETPVDFHEATQHNIPEDSHLHTENLKLFLDGCTTK
jgi:hypothetical protein